MMHFHQQEVLPYPWMFESDRISGKENLGLNLLVDYHSEIVGPFLHPFVFDSPKKSIGIIGFL